MPELPKGKIDVPDINKSHKSVRLNRGTNRFYNSVRWRKLSKLYLSNFPICEMCENDLSRHTDHIEPWQDGGKKYDYDNLQALCISCHAKKTASDIKRRKSQG